jgi:ATP-dependent helicase HrpB
MSNILHHPWVSRLPVVAVVPDLLRALSASSRAVLVAPPGAGKTTVVPLSLAAAGNLVGGRIVMLEPRRLAARAAAERMARLLGEPGPGGTVGFRVRGETRVGRGTRVEVVTEGVLTRMLQSDPSLAGVGLVIFDEFHERSLHADIGLALSLQARSLLRPDLKILVMSATLDAVRVAGLLDGAPVVASEGRTHPVETRWRRAPVGDRVETALAATVMRALAEDEGDLLVFLPGAGEIRRVARRLGELGPGPGVTVHPLFGDLDRGEQDAAIAPGRPGERKVVLATSIAETSLTIEGVRVVIDSGLTRVSRFDPGTGMSRLVTVRVTRDAADQRRGRAGREGAGVCYRLWTRAEERGLVPERQPEILAADLAPLALDLAAWGAAPDELRWLDPPPRGAYAQALELLRELEAVDDAGAITGHGRELARLGLHPRLGHMLRRGADLGLGDVACDVAAILSERDLLRGEGRAADADLRLRLELLRAADAPSRGAGPVAGHSIDRGALARVRRESHRLRKLAAGRSPAGAAAQPGPDRGLDAVGVLAALAYPDRVGQRREGERGRFLLRNGRGARFAEPQTLEGADWLVAADVEGRGTEARIFRAAALDRADLEEQFTGQVEERDEVFWEDTVGRVVARRRRALGALTLSEAPLEEPDPGAVGAAMLEGVRRAGLSALPWDRETRQLRDRLQFLHLLDPDHWPDTSDAALEATLEEWLLPFLGGARRLVDLRRVDLMEALPGRVAWADRRRLDDLAPDRVQVPSGSRIRVDYSDPEAPALAVRLQEVFGLSSTPTVGGGRVPLTMKLLSPAHRPVQVTRDLESFWRDGYFAVRKDLRGRYPKHYWPEDPLQAEATRRVRPSGDPG